MHAVFSTMPSISHEVSPYSYSGLSYEQLPSDAREILAQCGLSVEFYNPNAVDRARRRQAHKLHRNLQGVFEALVTKRREVVAINAALKNMVPGPEYDETKETYLRIASHVFYDLLPEVHEHIDRFIRDADALVWFEQQVREGTPDAVTDREVEVYRGNQLNSVIENAFDRLTQLDTAVVRMDLRMIESKVQEHQQALPFVAAFPVAA